MSEPHYQDATVTVHHGDCLDILRTLPDASVDSVVTDPPYGLEFMGKEWDGADGFRRSLNTADAGRDNVFGRTSRTSPEYRALHTFQQWCELWAAECLRVLKPGGHMLAFGGTRTWHRLACAVEDAGFEVRDSIAWLYGSGFPKSLDVSKAIDKAAGAEREVVGWYERPDGTPRNMADWSGRVGSESAHDWTPQPKSAPATPDAETWQGWGTALKPAFEPVVVARKPLVGTVAANVLTHGTGALNVDGCRVPANWDTDPNRRGWQGGNSREGYAAPNVPFGAEGPRVSQPNTAGRWPANVVLDESQAAALDQQSGVQRDGVAVNRNRGDERPMEVEGAPRKIGSKADVTYGGSGGASRFFYVAKAPKSERPRVDGIAHPTVKPLALMRWLVRLVTPPGGTVLEPFAGSGTTVEACILEGFHCLAIERGAEYLPLIEARIERATTTVEAIEPDLFSFDGGEATA